MPKKYMNIAHCLVRGEQNYEEKGRNCNVKHSPTVTIVTLTGGYRVAFKIVGQFSCLTQGLVDEDFGAVLWT